MVSFRDVQSALDVPDLRALLPQSSTSRGQTASDYPLVAYNFRVTVDGVAMSFTEVTGLNRQYEHVTYRHGFSFSEGEDLVKYHIDRYVSITMKRGTIRGHTALHAWLEEKADRAINISLCDADGKAVMTWKVAKAVAVKLDAPNFDASSNDAAIESLEVMAAGITVKAEG
jgi:phage tail-like protein